MATSDRRLLGALLSTDEYLVDTWLLTISYLYSALENGAELHLGYEVTDCHFEATSGHWSIEARKSPGGQTVSFTARVIVNCAGNYSDAVHKLLVSDEAEDPFQITPGKSCTGWPIWLLNMVDIKLKEMPEGKLHILKCNSYINI